MQSDGDIDMGGPPLDPDHVPTFKITALPLPITHEDILPDAIAERGFLRVCEVAGRQLGESVERTLLDGSADYGQGIPGLTNCSKAVRFGGGIGVEDAIKLLYGRRFYGPFAVAVDPKASVAEAEHRCLLDIEGVQAVIGTPALKAGESVIVQCTPDVVRIVLGLDVTLMQWDDGFKVACCIVPQVRCDFHSNVGVAVRRAT